MPRVLGGSSVPVYLRAKQLGEIIHLWVVHELHEKSAVWYKSTSLIRNAPLLGPYSRTIPRVPWWS